MTSNSQTPENIEWEWDDDASIESSEDMLKDKNGNYFVFAPGGPDKPGELKFIGASHSPVWVRPLPNIMANSAVLLSDENRLYAALFSRHATGSHVIALDAGSGEQLWLARIEGIGPKIHSKYANLVRIKRINDRLVVFGKESGGKYIEVLDSKTGEQLSNRQII